MMNMFKQFLKKLNLTEMIYMNWLEIYHVMMMKELYDISVLFLRCLRNLKKWSWLGKIGKNGVKNGVKKSVPKSANIHYFCLFPQNLKNINHIYNDHVGDDMTKEEFRRFCKKCWEKPHGFAVIDLTSKKDTV